MITFHESPFPRLLPAPSLRLCSGNLNTVWTFLQTPGGSAKVTARRRSDLTVFCAEHSGASWMSARS